VESLLGSLAILPGKAPIRIAVGSLFTIATYMLGFHNWRRLTRCSQPFRCSGFRAA